MESSEVLATENVLFGSSLVELSKSLHGELLAGDRALEIERHIVHQERFQLFLQPQGALTSLHVDAQGAQNGMLTQVDVGNQAKSFHVDTDTNPVEHLTKDLLLVKHILINFE